VGSRRASSYGVHFTLAQTIRRPLIHFWLHPNLAPPEHQLSRRMSRPALTFSKNSFVRSGSTRVPFHG